MALSKVLVPMPSSLSRVYPSPSIILWFVLSVKIHMHTHTYTQKKKKKKREEAEIRHVPYKYGAYYLHY